MTALSSSPTASDRTPDYVLVGHVTRDVAGDGFVVGGTVTYAGLTARALGRRVGVVTSAGLDVDLEASLPGITFRVQSAPRTTTFENVYHGGHREQWIRGVAAPLDLDLVPATWRSAPIVHLAPLVREIGPDIVAGLDHCGLLGITPQGWLRDWSSDGRVHRSAWLDPSKVLVASDAVVLSEEDVEGDWDVLRSYASMAKLLVVTQGARGCTVFERGHAWEVPAFPATEVDATGAGDVFAAAFFIALLDGGNPVKAAHYANCVASFAVEAFGTDGVPSPSAVAERLATRPAPVAME